MKRYGVASYDEFLETWSRPQVLIAVDSIFWAEPKEKADYASVAVTADELRNARAADVFSMLGM